MQSLRFLFGDRLWSIVDKMKKGLDLLQVYRAMEEVNELQVDFDWVVVHTHNFILLFSILSV